MGTTPTPAPAEPKLSLAEILQYVLQIAADVQQDLDATKTAEQKRQAALDAVAVALKGYLEYRGRAADQQAIYGMLVTVFDNGLALYKLLT